MLLGGSYMTEVPGTPLALGAISEQSTGGRSWPKFGFRVVSGARKGKEGRSPRRRPV